MFMLENMGFVLCFYRSVFITYSHSKTESVENDNYGFITGSIDAYLNEMSEEKKRNLLVCEKGTPCPDWLPLLFAIIPVLFFLR